MKMWKKAASVMLASAMVFSLAACGSSGDSGKSGGSSNSDTFKIGGIGPTTGDAAIYGTAVKNGIQLAVDEINAAGGINGKQIEYKFEDDQADSEKSVNAYNTLKDWGMQALIGTTTSTPCTAVVEETHSDNMFQLTPSATAVDSIQYDNAFRMCFSDPNQGSASADYIADNKLATKVAIIYNSSDTYSSGIYQTFATEAKAKGLDVVAAEAFTANATDEATQKFVADYKEAFGDTPIQFAADAYDCVYVIKAAAEKEDVTPDKSVSDICDALKKGMTEITYDGLTGKSITWSEDGEPTKDPTVVVVKSGEYQVLQAEDAAE